MKDSKSQESKLTSEISTVVFDLSEVLLTGLLGMREPLATRLGLSSEEIDFKVPELQMLFEGKISEEHFWEALLREQGWAIEIEELKNLVRENFLEIEGTKNIVEEVKRAGYQVALFSVHASEWIAFCEEKFDHGALFEQNVYSFQIGICKPEKRAFEILVEQLSVSADSILFIDDSDSNIVSAKEVGMQTLLFTSAEQLRADLVRAGLLA